MGNRQPGIHNNLTDRIRAEQRGNDDFRAIDSVGGRRRGQGTEIRQGDGRAAGPIPHRDVMAVGDEMGGHLPAHAAETEERDLHDHHLSGNGSLAINVLMAHL
ncbi:MAG TPA: hypothetical protein VG296_17370 [Actinospica sp.]|nr:hypothetical protein [Actinospica sp.]HWG25885.1 hypothetical protein [Actinospica sp.]